MSVSSINLASPLAEPIRQFLAAKRALNRRFDTEEKALRLFDRHLVDRGVARLSDVTPAVIEAFVTSRPRKRPRSYNHLLGVLRRPLADYLEFDSAVPFREGEHFYESGLRRAATTARRARAPSAGPSGLSPITSSTPSCALGSPMTRRCYPRR